MSKYFLILFLLATSLVLHGQAPAGSSDRTYLQFPSNPVSDIATFYEALTGKRLIRDANLAGPNLTLTVAQPVTRKQAQEMIEAVLMLNGYTLIAIDENTSKLIGPARQTRSESTPMFLNEADLPAAEQLVSYYMPLEYISSGEAKEVFGSYVTIRPYGAIVPVPNSNAIVITENVSLVQRLIELKKLIDVPGSRVATEFFTLERADATKVAELIGEMYDKQAGAKPAANGQPPAPATGSGVQVFPDVRTNRVIVMAPEQQMPLIRKLVGDLDVSVAFEEPFERPLRFVSAADVLPVLANMLSDDKTEAATPEVVGSTASAESRSLVMDSTSGGGSGYSNYSGSGSGGATKPDRLRNPSDSTAPLSKVVGNSRLIADRSANKIVVIGPPESRAKAAKVLDILDQRPKQIYLAVIIGQLTLGRGVEAGIDYGMKFGDVRIQGQGTAANIGNLASLQNRNPPAAATGVDLLPDTTQAVNTAVNTANQLVSQALPLLSGLTVFGTIADSVDVYARALGTNNKFEVISRPVIYTANNKKAVISSGLQVPVPQSTLTSALDSNINAQSAAIASNLEYKDVVLKLEVIPLINSNDEVTLTIAQQNDNIQDSVEVANNTVPVIGTQELTTTVTVPNRHTIALGGLITNQEERVQTGVPFLKDIPGVGYLFSTTKKDVTRRELIVLIQPFIIDDESKLQEANLIERANTSFQSGMYEDKIPVKKALLPDTPKRQEQVKKEKEKEKAQRP